MNQSRKFQTRDTALFAILLSIGLVLHYLESFFCIPVGGFLLKIGMSNVVILFYIVQNENKEAILMAICKILLSLFFSPTLNFSNFLISFGGLLLSFVGMTISSKLTNQKIIPVSITGGILHNMGQLIAVIYLVRMTFFLQQIWFFSPLLIILGSFSGFVVGSVTQLILSKLSKFPKKSDYNNK